MADANKGGGMSRQVFKVIVVGNVFVGKTSIVKRLAYGAYTADYKGTLGVDFAVRDLEIKPVDVKAFLGGVPPTHLCTRVERLTPEQGLQGSIPITIPDTHPLLSETSPGLGVRLQLWDIGGQERAAVLSRAYYRDAVGAVVVTDLSRTTWRDDVLVWKRDIDARVMYPGTSRPVPTFLLINKIDLSEVQETLLGADIGAFVRDNGFSGFYATSSKAGTNLDCAFSHLSVLIAAQQPAQQPLSQSLSRSQVVSLTERPASDTSTKSSSCC
ncbi:putative Rab32 [Giardia muris]|uniref:Putative Rab32 n=1 Tax=Giardia muris TaxID=5742 RepID=A0A4Z1T100_GIAMU|nr:putative Rab32 [Giardia muris]|eukprot:TNJ26597.1 putative Rab32 [Giardia muris]